ncbi:MAG: hypothetical protein PHV82_08625, partial [Victivallaceae bacterium]|nr:hypothetical protein [Victivallaceae bacterium]
MASNLSQSLNKLKRINYRRTLFNALCRLAAMDLFALTALFGLDNLTSFSSRLRFVVLAVFVIGNVALLLKLGLDLYRSRLSDRQAALKLEELHGIRDNSLINAVCFRSDETISEELRSLFLASADRRCGKLKLPGIWKNRTCRRLSKVLLTALIAAACYVILFRNYAANAAARFANPWTQLASLNFTQFQVQPGDIKIAAGRNLPVRAKAFRGNKKINNLKILLTVSGISSLYPMRYRKGIAEFTITNIAENMTYRIFSGNDSSRDFEIKIVPAPEFKKFVLKVTPPAYTRLKSASYDLKTNTVEAPAGSAISITAENFSGDGTEFFQRKDKKTQKLPALFELREDILAGAAIIRNGIKYPDIWHCAFLAKKDMPPVVRFMNRQNNIEAGIGQAVPVYISAWDDYGIKALRVVLANQGRKGVYRQFNYQRAPQTGVREALMLKLTPEICSAGTVLELSAQALDSRMPGQTGTTDTNLTVHVIDLVKKAKENVGASVYSGMYELLFKAMEKQQEVRNWLSARAGTIRRREVYYLVDRQKDIKNILVSAASKADKLKKDFAARIRKIAGGSAEELINASGRLAASGKERKLEQEVNSLVRSQSILIREIRTLLGMIAVKENAEEEKKELLAEEKREKEFFDKLDNVRADLERFMKEQKKIIADTEAVDKKDPEDWSEAEEKLLGNLAARELDWAKFFKAAFNDLSKLQNQDFSNSAMADEFVEMYEELQKAGDALKKKKIKE